MGRLDLIIFLILFLVDGWVAEGQLFVYLELICSFLSSLVFFASNLDKDFALIYGFVIGYVLL